MTLMRIFDIMAENLQPHHLNDPKVTTFIQALCIELNFKDACKRADVGEARGKSYFRELDVTKTIDKIREEMRGVSNQLKGDMLVKDLEEMKAVDPIDVFDDYGFVKPLSQIPAHVRRTFKKFKVKYEYIENEQTGLREKVPAVYDIEFFDKTKAIELIGVDIDRFKKKHEHKHEHDLGKNAGALLLGNTVDRADERIKQLQGARDVSPNVDKKGQDGR